MRAPRVHWRYPKVTLPTASRPPAFYGASSLSDLKNRSENLTGRSQISSILKGNSSSIARESGGIWIVQADLQPISFKSDRLLGPRVFCQHHPGFNYRVGVERNALDALLH